MNQILGINLSRNDKHILGLIYKYKNISRTELLEISNLKIATFYRTIDSLIAKKMINAVRSDENSSVGRPSDILSVNSNYSHFFCILVWRNITTVAIIDFSGSIISEQSFNCNKVDPTQLIKHCYELYCSLTDKLNLDYKKCIGITISTFGEPILSPDNEVLPSYPGFKWGNFDVVPELRKIFNKPVWFEYNARSAATGCYVEKYFRKYDNLAYVIISEGIGLGIILDGRIIPKDDRIINGLGHMVVDINGLRCICGKYGCMETKVSKLAILASALSELKLGKESVLKNKLESITWIDVCKAADNGDKISAYVIETAAHTFAIGLENLLNVLGINLIILGGGIPENSKLFCNTIKERFSRINTDLRIELETHEKDMIIKGCTTAYIMDLLKT